ncbi:MAG: hypothetical protein KDB27_28340 [Planctomycetales bacterium]|nr:hypothetical protein [Planctomycetales bacterium]
MWLREQISGVDVQIDENAIVSRGEGAIYRLIGNHSFIAKIYHKPSAERTEKVQELLAMRPCRKLGQHRDVAWPSDILLDPSGVAVGHTMPWLGDAKPLSVLLNAHSRIDEFPTVTFKNLVSVAANLATLVDEIHATKRIVLCDFNADNVLVKNNSSLVSLIDLDGAQITAADGTIYPCRVITDDYGAPEQRNVNLADIEQLPSADLFGLAVMLHQLMLACSPYDGKWMGSGLPPHMGQRIESNLLARPYCDSAPRFRFWKRSQDYIVEPHYAVPTDLLSDMINSLLGRSFWDGHEKPEVRPTAREWADALNQFRSNLIQCPSRPQHWYGNSLKFCPWCRLKKEKNADYFPTPARSQQPSNPTPRRTRYV